MGRFNGYLIKVGDYEVPLRLVQAETYDAKVNTLDEDAEQDNFGVLHRNVIQQIPIVQFETIALDENDLNAFMDACRAEYDIVEERKALCSVWVPEYGRYVSMDMYMSDPSIKIDHIDMATSTVYYMPFTVRFNGYGED